MKLLLISFFLLLPTEDRLVAWTNTFKKKGDLTELNFKGKIEDNWYVYSSKLEVDGPLPTEIKWDKSSDFEVIGTLEAVKPKKKHDDIWEGNIHYFEKEGSFTQKIKVLKPNATVSGTIRYQVCINDPEDGRCVNEEEKFSFKLL